MDKEFWTAKELVEELDIDRSTLTRLHTNGKVPECKKWGRKPQPHRLYDAGERRLVTEFIKSAKSKMVPKGVELIDNG